ncbi:MAG: FAD-binding protein [Gemmatimonadota bacterium]|nr:FAD-binding protein [Gemmatimonadota bacterium]MDE3172066.1 FAD-binding protein [Gemmatimonadota bacterium]MDE3215346.1 FAD-binding protein [Gemmatimonadota bacterium]
MSLPAPPGFRGAFRTDDAARAVYGEAAGIARCWPAAVAVPADARDVQTLVGWAHRERTALIPRGSGSGMAGGAVGEGVVVDLSRLRTLGDVNLETRTVRVGPGVLRAEVDRAARAVGLRFPVDPSSGAFCTVGGMAATNAAGADTMRHGPMRNWVQALTAVFDDSSSAELRRGTPAPREIAAVGRFLRDAHDAILRRERVTPSVHRGVLKDSSGYATAAYASSGDLLDLLVGSEGTLALFTELELRLEPIPVASASLLGEFRSLDGAVRAAAEARKLGAGACELLDRTFLEVAASGGASLPVAAGAEGVLLVKLEGETTRDVGARARSIEQAFRRLGASAVNLALDAGAERDLWELRHAVSPILSRLDPSLKSMQFVEDGAVPPEHLADYVRGVRAALERHKVKGVIFGHAGDAHIHVNPLIDVSQPNWRARLEGILDAVVALTASLGGTLTGEHGDGRLRTPLLARVWTDAARERFGLVKRCFDPANILNPGVKVPLAGQRPLRDVKYDPELPAPPAAAARALDRVERDRAYGEFRLALLEAPVDS